MWEGAEAAVPPLWVQEELKHDAGLLSSIHTVSKDIQEKLNAKESVTMRLAIQCPEDYCYKTM